MSCVLAGQMVDTRRSSHSHGIGIDGFGLGRVSCAARGCRLYLATSKLMWLFYFLKFIPNQSSLKGELTKQNSYEYTVYAFGFGHPGWLGTS